MYKLVHVGEEVEEHVEESIPQTQTETQSSQNKEIPPQTVDIGFYFAAGVIGLVAVGFLVHRFLKK